MARLAGLERAIRVCILIAAATTLLAALLWITSLADFSAVILAIGGGFLVFAAVRFDDALLTTTALLPLVPVMGAVWLPGSPLTELVVLILVAGGLTRGHRVVAEEDLLQRCCALFVLAVICSAVPILVTENAPREALAQNPGSLATMAGELFTGMRRVWTWVPARYLLAGALLMLMTRSAATLRPAIVEPMTRMLVVGAAAAAALNILRIVGVVLRSEGSAATFWQLFSTLRVNVHYSDLNAAGSFFALTLPLATSMLIGASKGRVAWILAVALIACGLWLTGARAALLAVVFVLAMSAAFNAAPRRYVRSAVVAGLLVVAAFLVVSPKRSFQGDAREALMLRKELADASLRMFSTSPIVGVGVGRFYERSSGFFSQHLQSYYPRENAHNQFLQILAELGLSGLTLFSSMILLGMGVGRRSPESSPSSYQRGLTLGLIAFLLTCLTGHPLLTQPVAFLFWMSLGLHAADVGNRLAVGPTLARLDRGFRPVVPFVALALVCAIPYRIRAELQLRNLPLVAVIDPESQSLPANIPNEQALLVQLPFRFSVPARAAAVELQMRTDGSPEIGLDLWVDGRLRDKIRVTESWGRYRIQVPERTREAGYRRFELRDRRGPSDQLIIVRPIFVQ